MNKFDERAEKAYWLTVFNKQVKKRTFWQDMFGAAIALAVLYFGLLFLLQI